MNPRKDGDDSLAGKDIKGRVKEIIAKNFSKIGIHLQWNQIFPIFAV